MGRRNLPIAHVALVLILATSNVHGIPSEDSKYDFGTTIFSPKGRLYQVEYASEAVNRARPAVGICTDEGAVLCSLKTIYNTRLQAGDRREKTSLLDSHVVCASAGLTADMMVLVRDCRASAQQHYITFQEPIPVQKLATHIADVKQAYTQHGGLRPWGVSMLLVGYDVYRGVQLYKTEPNGNFGAFKAVAVGAGARRISARLASGYRDKMGLAEAVRLAVSVLDGERKRELRAQDKGTGGSDEYRGIGMEVATVAIEKGQEGAACSAHVYDDADVERLLESLSKDKMETQMEAPENGDGDA